MRSWVYGATYGAAASTIVLVVGSLLIPRNDIISDEPPTAQINSEDLAATADAEGKVKALSGADTAEQIALSPSSTLPEAPALERHFAGEVQLTVPEIGTMEVTALAGPPPDLPLMPPKIGNWSAPTVQLVKLGALPNAETAPRPDLSKPPYYGAGIIDTTEPSQPAATLPGTTAEVQTAEVGETKIPTAGTFGRTPSRLPQIGATAPAAASDAPAAGEGALTTNASPWVDPGVPKIAVVLTGMDATFALPQSGDLPLSVMIGALDEAAADEIASVRGLSQEVVLVTPLPDGATASDAQVAFETYRPLLGSAVALMEAGEGQFMSHDVAEAVVDLAGTDGLGVVTASGGLNPVAQIAETTGAHASLITRDLTDVAGDAGALKRALDQAAFKAGQDGAVILLAPATSDVIATLREWQGSARGKTVSLAPLSAVLRDK